MKQSLIKCMVSFQVFKLDPDGGEKALLRSLPFLLTIVGTALKIAATKLSRQILRNTSLIIVDSYNTVGACCACSIINNLTIKITALAKSTAAPEATGYILKPNEKQRLFWGQRPQVSQDNRKNKSLVPPALIPIITRH
jgi:hypothetical protein